MSQLNRYSAMKEWERVKGVFADLHGYEDEYNLTIFCMEKQIVFMSRRYRLVDEEAMHALIMCGCRIIEQCDPEKRYEFSGFPKEVVELADRICATFHPAYNSEVQILVQDNWKSEQELLDYFLEFGAVVRRIIDSAKFWGKSDFKGYLRYIAADIGKVSTNLDEDRIDIAIPVRSPNSIG